MKTIEEIKKEIATECAEEHFEVLLNAEISVGDYEQARKLLIDVANRYIDQFEKREDTINAEIDKWLDETDFGYGSTHLLQRNGAIMAIKWFKNRFLKTEL